MLPLHRAVLVLLAGSVVFGACRRRSKPDVTAVQPPGDAAAPVDQSAGAPDTSVALQTYLAPPPSATPLPIDEAHRFIAPEPMNMYSPAGPGDYQAQLNAYNLVLRKWAAGADIPQRFHDLMATYNSPKPPQPPVGRKLVYDRRTVTVSLQ